MTAFVADEHIPEPSIRLLRSAGHDVLSIRDECPSVEDSLVLRLAQSQDRLLISCDRDFGKLLFQRQMECTTGIVYLRLGNFEVAEPAEFVLKYLKDDENIYQGKFSVIDRERIRQRDL